MMRMRRSHYGDQNDDHDDDEDNDEDDLILTRLSVKLTYKNLMTTSMKIIQFDLCLIN